MSSQIEQTVDKWEHSRALVRKAVHQITTQRKLGNMNYYFSPFSEGPNTHVGPTYPEIRLWIQKEEDIHVEGVDRRCRELFDAGEFRRETDGKGRIHVYPVKEA